MATATVTGSSSYYCGRQGHWRISISRARPVSRWPDGGLQRLGTPLAWNTALQYRILSYFWPEFELNYSWWPNGEREGEIQVFLTAGILVGRIPIHERVDVTVGFGYQVAVTKNPMYNRAAILSGRIPFWSLLL
jgi:hypothetical protein